MRRAGLLPEPADGAAAVAEPRNAQSEAGGRGVRVPVPKWIQTPPWAAAEASREAVAPEAECAEPGKRAYQGSACSRPQPWTIEVRNG